MRTSERIGATLALGGLCVFAVVACVTPAQMRKVENRVTDIERGGGGGGGAERQRLADLGSELESLERTVQELEGRLEVAEHRVDAALKEARSARAEAAALAAAGGAAAAAVDDSSADDPAQDPEGDASDEVQSYRLAYAEWRTGNSEGCIDQFTKFLQTYPASDYADDATYWLADCYFKQGNYSAAVLRFDDVARQYPSGNKAPDALYRQGEALLRMGHGKAAGNAFEKVIRDYPDSARAPEAKRQLELLGAG